MNAKEELIQTLTSRNLIIKCAYVHTRNPYYDMDDDFEVKEAILPLNFSFYQLTEFYDKLNFEYDSGYNGQELYGNVWLEDGTWLERGEYDGSEWREHAVRPEIPIQCLNS